jgi:PAS domain-containing protein
MDETGRITHFMAVKEDTTERKQMLEALRESESNLAAVFNATNEAIFLMAVDHTLLALNDAALQRTGLPREAALGRKTYEILHRMSLSGGSHLLTARYPAERRLNLKITGTTIIWSTACIQSLIRTERPCVWLSIAAT